MKILFLTQVLPYPLDAGPKTRAYYVLRYLAQTHDVVLVSFVRTTDTEGAYAHLGQFCTELHVLPMPRSRWQDGIHLLRSQVSPTPFLIQRDRVAAMTRLVSEVIAESGPFDAIHADQLWMAPYALQAQQCSPAGQRPVTVLDQHNAVFLIPERLAAHERNPAKRVLLAIEARKLARYEVRTCAEFDNVAWVTKEDFHAVNAQAAVRQKPLPGTATIPICVEPTPESCVERKLDARRVTFLGGLHYPPNAQGVMWYAEQVFPQVLSRVPDAVLTVIGKQPPEALNNLGIPSRNLDITGYVADPKPYLVETAAFIVPLHSGGGMRVKILDAWMWGVPVVSTTVGAEGVDTSPGENILIADDGERFAEMTEKLLREPELAARVARAGWRTVETHYDWRTRYKEWDKIYG